MILTPQGGTVEACSPELFSLSCLFHFVSCYFSLLVFFQLNRPMTRLFLTSFEIFFFVVFLFSFPFPRSPFLGFSVVTPVVFLPETWFATFMVVHFLDCLVMVCKGFCFLFLKNICLVNCKHSIYFVAFFKFAKYVKQIIVPPPPVKVLPTPLQIHFG